MWEMRKIDKIDIENLNPLYKELAYAVGTDSMLNIYSLFKGQQISFPTRLFSKEYITKSIMSEYNGSNIKDIALKYDYSERWVREIISRKKSGFDNKKQEEKNEQD